MTASFHPFDDDRVRSRRLHPLRKFQAGHNWYRLDTSLVQRVEIYNRVAGP